MPVQTNPLTSDKNRSLPILPEGVVMTNPITANLLRGILDELYRIRLILATSFDVMDEFDEVTSEMEDL